MKELSIEQMASLRGGFLFGGNEYYDSFNKVVSADNYAETTQLNVDLHSRGSNQVNKSQTAVGNISDVVM